MGAIFLLLALSPSAVNGGGGFEAVAVSRDGKRLAVGGQNRVVYVLDADALRVTRRLAVGTRVGGLAFTPDGKGLLVEDETDTLRLLDAESGKEKGKLVDVNGLLLSPGGDLVAVRDLRRTDRPALRLLSASTLKDVGTCLLTERAAAFAFSPDGKSLVVLEDGHNSDENIVPLNKVPESLKGLARLEYQQKNDGRSSWLRTFQAPTGKEASRVEVWYTTGSLSTSIQPAAEGVYVINRVNLCALVGAKGAVALFQVGERGPLASAFSPDGKTLWLGGRSGGTYGPARGKQEPFALDELPGQAEFVTRLAVRGPVTYGVTTAFRVFRVEKRATRAVAVY